MYMRSTLWASALLACARAQFASFSEGSYALSVNVPQDTASGSSETIYLQISAPSGTEWVGFGYGSQMMAGASMFVVYADGNNNVTVSPRTGRGQVEPLFDSSARITVLEGSRSDSQGMVANVRCDSCIGSSLSATSSSSNWIYAYLSGSALDSTDTSADITQHQTQGSFTLDLTQGTGGSSLNPFIAAAAQPSGSASASGSGSGSSPSATASGSSPSGTSSNGNIAPVASSSPDGSSSGSSNSASRVTGDNTISLRKTHGIIMSITFLVLFPLAALTLYLSFAKRVLLVHAPLQVVGTILMLVGLATGVILGNRISELDQYHMIIGYIIVAVLILAQPLLGLLQHMYFRRHGGRSIKGVIHQWLGRCAILAGVVNGGLGFNITGPVGSTYVPRGAVIAYGVIAGLVGLIYIAVVVLAGRRSSRSGALSPRAEKNGARYNETELQPRGGADREDEQYWQPQGQVHGAPKRGNSQRF